MTHDTESPEERPTLPPPGPPSVDRRREINHELADAQVSYGEGATMVQAGVGKMTSALSKIVSLNDELEGVSSL